MRTVAILIAASPTPAFFSQIAALSLALRRLRWSHWNPHIHAYFGGLPEPSVLSHWSPHLRDVNLHFTAAAQFDIHGDWAQSDDAFRLAPRAVDVLLALDADTFVVSDLEEILDETASTGAVGGVIAHFPTILPHTIDPVTGSLVLPTPTSRHSSISEAWRRLAEGLIDQPLEFRFSHTLMSHDAPEEHRLAPFYVNFGVVFFPRNVFDDLVPRYLTLRTELMGRLSQPDFAAQAALTLAVTAAGTKTRALPMRYNFPNDPIAERLHPTEAESVVVFHYLRTNRFDRREIFLGPKQYEAFLGLHLQGIDRRFQDAVRSIVGERYPFA